MAIQLDCPSCGASVKAKRNEKSAVCNYCGNSVLVPDYTPEAKVNANTVAFGQSCSKIALMIIIGSVLLSLLLGFIVYFLFSAEKEAGYNQSNFAYTENTILEFGSIGTAPGSFQKPCFIALGENNNIIVGERETGRIQTFDTNGNLLFYWQFSDNEEVILQGMASSGEGKLFLVYNGGLYCYNATSGQLIDSLNHPEGRGFSDVDVTDDGSVLAAWYLHHDDIIKFSNQGEVEFIIDNAISRQSGEPELSTKIIAGNLGDIYGYGSFNTALFKFNSSGRYQDRFGDDELFTMPLGFDVDTRGRVWVSDFGEMLVFSDSGELTYRIKMGYSISDFVITFDMQLYGITSEAKIVQIDLSNY